MCLSLASTPLVNMAYLIFVMEKTEKNIDAKHLLDHARIESLTVRDFNSDFKTNSSPLDAWLLGGLKLKLQQGNVQHDCFLNLHDFQELYHLFRYKNSNSDFKTNSSPLNAWLLGGLKLKLQQGNVQHGCYIIKSSS